jgi:hypothetical protein
MAKLQHCLDCGHQRVFIDGCWALTHTACPCFPRGSVTISKLLSGEAGALYRDNGCVDVAVLCSDPLCEQQMAVFEARVERTKARVSETKRSTVQLAAYMQFGWAIRVELAWQHALRMAVNQRVATANTPHMTSMNMLRMVRRVPSDHSVSQESGHGCGPFEDGFDLGCSLACSHAHTRDVGAHTRPIARVRCGLNQAQRRWSNEMCCTWPQSSIAATLSAVPFCRQRCAHRVCVCGVVLVT